MILHKDRKSFEEIIIQTANYYKSDYEEITCNLLFENVNYKTVKDALTDIIGKFK